MFSRTTLVFLGSFLSALLTYATTAHAEHELPTHLCSQGCSPRMAEIVKGFESAEPLTPVTSARIHSGVCMHQVNELGPEDEHHGVIVLEKRDDDSHFNGQFSFYAKENPYKDWTIEEAARRLPLKYNDLNKITFESDYAWLDYNPGSIPIWQYYLRQSGPTVYLIGFWDTRHTVFCEMKENSAAK